MESIKLYLAFSKVAFLTQLEYRGEYFVRILSKVISFGGSFIMLLILLSRFKSIGGWGMYEVLLLHSMNILTYSFAATFVMGPFENLSQNIRLGTFDSVLVRPVNPLFYYVCQNVSAGYTRNNAIVAIVMIICFIKLQITVTPLGIFLFIISFIGGILIHASTFMIMYIPAFWLTESRSIFNLFYHDLSRFVDYPLSIFPKLVQGLLTFVLPYALISFYPVGLLLGKGDSAFGPALYYATPFAGIALSVIAYNFWKAGITSYKSSGS